MLSDTVGFIRNLPHTLVTSFRATLEEVERAEVLLHVRDASSAMMDEQKEQVEKVLGELDVRGKPVIEVLNKIDLLPLEERGRLGRGKSGGPVTVAVSGLTKVGLDRLLEAIDAALVVDPLVVGKFRIPRRPKTADRIDSPPNQRRRIRSKIRQRKLHDFAGLRLPKLRVQL